MGDKTPYSVGQVVYIVPTQKRIVYPMRIIEEITRKNASSVNTEYVLQGGTPGTTISMKDVDGTVYDSPERVRRALIASATEAINKMVDHAEAKASEWFKAQERLVDEQIADESEDEETIVELPDGTKAKLKRPIGT